MVQHISLRDHRGHLRFAIPVDDRPGTIQAHLRLGGPAAQDRQIGQGDTAHRGLTQALDGRDQGGRTDAVACREPCIDGPDDALFAQ